MAFFSVTKYLRDGVIAMLEDGTVGFNAMLAAAVASYGTTGFTLDFATTSANFFQGRLSEALLEETSYVHDQFACLYTISTEDGNDSYRQVSRKFAGTVSIGLDFYLGYRSETADVNFELLADAVTDAVHSVFGGQNAALWPPGIVRKFSMSSQRSRLTLESSNWLQEIHFEIPFEVFV